MTVADAFEVAAALSQGGCLCLCAGKVAFALAYVLAAPDLLSQPICRQVCKQRCLRLDTQAHQPPPDRSVSGAQSGRSHGVPLN